MSERIPKATAEKFSAITTSTDAFCAQHLNEDYRQMIQQIVTALGRKRPSPLLRGVAADIRHALMELLRRAHEKGLIACVPAEASNTP